MHHIQHVEINLPTRSIIINFLYIYLFILFFLIKIDDLGYNILQKFTTWMIEWVMVNCNRVKYTSWNVSNVEILFFVKDYYRLDISKKGQPFYPHRCIFVYDTGENLSLLHKIRYYYTAYMKIELSRVERNVDSLN